MNTNEPNGQTFDGEASFSTPQETFGEVIFVYSRSQAVADGVQVEVTQTAQEAGIKFPMFLTRAVFDTYVAVPEGVTAQDEAGRLWDIVWMTRFAILRASRVPRSRERERVSKGRVRDVGLTRLPVALYVRNDNRKARLVKLIATCGPLDIDDPSPAITVMLPDED